MGDALYAVDGRARGIAATLLDTVHGGWKILESSIQNVGIMVGRALMPALREAMSALVDVANWTADWATENGELIVTIGQWAVGLVAAGAALTALGTTVAFAGMVISGLASILAVFTGALAFVFSGSGLVALGAVGLVALALRLGIVQDAVLALGVGLAGLGVVLYQAGRWLFDFAAQGENSTGQLTTAWQRMTADMEVAWKGIVDAIRTNDLELVVDIAGAGMEIALARMRHALERWTEQQLLRVRNFMNRVAHEVSFGAVALDPHGPSSVSESARQFQIATLTAALQRLTMRAETDRAVLDVWNSMSGEWDAAMAFLTHGFGGAGGPGGRGGVRPPGIPDLTFDDKEKKKREAAVRAYDPPDAVERGTQAAVSIINQSRNREQELQERMLIAEERGVRYLEEVRDALRRLPIIGAANF